MHLFKKFNLIENESNLRKLNIKSKLFPTIPSFILYKKTGL